MGVEYSRMNGSMTSGLASWDPPLTWIQIY
jgi:hypothetical protein